MPLMIQETKSSFKPVPQGMHHGRCYMVIYLGTQIFNYNGEQKASPKVMFTWELAELMEDGKPFSISKEYSFFLSDKSNLKRDLVSWRGKQFTEVELNGFDIFSVLNAQCLLNVVHKQTSKGNIIAEISSITPLVKGMPKIEAVNESKTLNLTPDEYSMEVFDSLPGWIKDKIKKSPEWQALEGTENVEHSEDYHQADEMPPLTEDIPF